MIGNELFCNHKLKLSTALHAFKVNYTPHKIGAFFFNLLSVLDIDLQWFRKWTFRDRSISSDFNPIPETCLQSHKNSLNWPETPTYPNPKSKKSQMLPHKKSKQKYPVTNFTKSDTNTRNPSQETHKESSKRKYDRDPDEKNCTFSMGKVKQAVTTAARRRKRSVILSAEPHVNAMKSLRRQGLHSSSSTL